MSEAERARFEVLLEEIRGSVQAIAEGHGALNDRLGRIETKVDDMADDMAGFKIDMASFRTDTVSRLGRIEKHLKLNDAKRPSAKRSKK